MSSLQSLLWTVLLLFLLLYVFAVFVTQLVLEHRVQLDHETADDVRIVDFWGSLSSSMLSLYQAISGGVSWRDSVQPVIRQIGILPGIIIICYIGFATLALLNVVTGVFVQTALKSAQDDEAGYMLHHMHELFAHADKDNTGVITWDNFMELANDPRMAEFFEAIDVDTSEAPGVFHLLDSDDSGEIDLNEFLHGCLSLHGPAKALHLSTLMMETRTLLRYQVTRTRLIIDLLFELAAQTGMSNNQLENFKPPPDENMRRQSFLPNCADLSTVSTHAHSRASIGKGRRMSGHSMDYYEKKEAPTKSASEKMRQASTSSSSFKGGTRKSAAAKLKAKKKLVS